MKLFDAHNHWQDGWLLPHHARILADLAQENVQRMVVNGTGETDWPDVAALAVAHPVVLPSFGLHPWDAGNRSPDWKEKLLARLDADPQAAVGEIGLDRWILERARPDDPRLAGLRRAPLEEQAGVFLWQLTLAAERNLPASIHCLDAWGPLLDLLRATRLPARGFLLHAYSGPLELVAAFAGLGACFSFNGSFLAPQRKRLREVFAKIPADRLLVETDAPAMRLPADREQYHLPAAENGSPVNHLANLAATYAALAELRGVRLETLADTVAGNFHRLFGAPA